MFSLQRFFGTKDVFFDLLEQSANEARKSVQALNRVLTHPDQSPSLEEFRRSKETDKQITEQIGQALVKTFVTTLEREDIESLSSALYKIPKTVEKFAERFIISNALVQKTDFSKQVNLMDGAAQQVVAMVGLLRDLGAGRLDQAKEMNRALQQIEGDADKLILEVLKDLYSGRHEATKVMALKDLYELIEKVVDQCRDAGNVVTHIVLKNS